MREFKFRFWDMILKSMNYRNPLTYDFAHKEIIPQQFTGSIDCKGNEIYEGDIVLLSEGFHPRKRPVVFSEYGAWYIGELGISFGQIKADGFVHCEVIGNIYENPKLLSGSEV